jgi:3-methyladenine DNA glycosylase Tag
VLSWITILRKRDAYRRAFDRFDPRKVASYDKRKIGALGALTERAGGASRGCGSSDSR